MAFKKIVVATDGSSNAHRAVLMAGDLAAKYSAKVYLVHCVLEGSVPQGLLQWARVEHLVPEEKEDDMPKWPGYGNLGVIGPNRVSRVSNEARMQLGRAILDEAKARLTDAGAKDIHEVFEDGDAARVVVAVAEREKADLAVVGTRGLGIVDQVVLGSISHKLISMRSLPVLTVP
jgi:nucleotide-binding universal stress UspA family protein